MLIHSPQTLAKLIHDQRKRSRLSQSQATVRVGMKQNTLSRFETQPERSQLTTLFRILSALDLEMHVIPKSKAKDSTSWKEEW
jgi:HTH-type transcriptional regulator / antitoxin HipB